MASTGGSSLTRGARRPVMGAAADGAAGEVPVDGSEDVLVERGDGVAQLTLHRPERRNALTVASVRRLTAAVTGALDDPDVGALLLRGADHCFCSGIDLRAADTTPSGGLDPAWSARFHAAWLELHRTLAAADKPVVAALERAAVNAGAALALSADLLVAGRASFLRIAEVERDMVARVNLAWLVARHGSARALDLTLTGRRVDGAELYRLGMAYACADDATPGDPSDGPVVETARRLAASLAALPRTGVTQTKRLIRTLESPAAPAHLLTAAIEADLTGEADGGGGR